MRLLAVRCAATAGAVAVLLSGCATRQRPALPPVPPARSFSSAEPVTRAQDDHGASVEAPALPQFLTLKWDYETSPFYIVFNLYSKTNLSERWQLLAEIPSDRRTFVVTNDSPARFFLLTASNTVFGGESPEISR